MGDINQDRPDLVKQGWTQQMWDARQGQDWFTKAFSNDNQFADRWKSGGALTGVAADAPGRGGQAAPSSNPQADFDAQIDEFYKHMNAPLDTNDPDVQEVMKISSRTAGNEAEKRGLNGGAVATEAGRRASIGTNQIRQFRQGLASQALSMKGQRANSLANLAEQQYQFDQGRADQQAQGQAAAMQNLIGGLGSAAGAYFGAGTSLGAQGGAQLGAGLGSGLGGIAAQPGYGQAPRQANSTRWNGNGRGY